MAGMTETDLQLKQDVESELDRLLEFRVTNFTKDTYWIQPEEDYYWYHKKHLDVARNFMYLVPELGELLDKSISIELSEALEEYQYITPYWFVSRYESTKGEGDRRQVQ